MFYSPVCSPIAVQVFLSAVAHACQVFLQVGFSEEDAGAEWALEILLQIIVFGQVFLFLLASGRLCIFVFRPVLPRAIPLAVLRVFHVGALSWCEPEPPSRQGMILEV